jgi:hypothetical protein
MKILLLIFALCSPCVLADSKKDYEKNEKWHRSAESDVSAQDAENKAYAKIPK